MRGLAGAGSGARHRLERSGDDVAIHANAVESFAALGADLDIGGGLRIGAGANRILVIIEEGEIDTTLISDSGDKSRDRAVANALDLPLRSIDDNLGRDAPLPGGRLGEKAVV